MAVAEGPANGRGITIEVSPGELVDRLTILEIKSVRIADPAKRTNVAHALQLMRAARARALPASAELDRLTAELKAINEALWQIEDEIRACEAAKDFGPRFVELARSVYRTNDRRAAAKSAIDRALGSALTDEKFHPSY